MMTDSQKGTAQMKRPMKLERWIVLGKVER